MKSRMRYKKKPPLLILSILSLLIVIILSCLLVWLVLLREYKAWEKDFEEGKDEGSYIVLSDTSLRDNAEKKLLIFSKSNTKVDFVELSDREFLFLIGESLNTSLPLGIQYKKGYVESNKGFWDVYVQTNLKSFELPWLVFRLQKDQTETPQIYVDRMSVGNFDFTDYGAGLVINKINKGINEAILLVNESDFTGRVFQNIELEKGKVIIKGEK
ncbi:hypothetical protein IT417_00365 [bacterium]|nr:hypothetical protein [bacterium]